VCFSGDVWINIAASCLYNICIFFAEPVQLIVVIFYVVINKNYSWAITSFLQLYKTMLAFFMKPSYVLVEKNSSV